MMSVSPGKVTDWKCEHCETSNSINVYECAVCGVDKNNAVENSKPTTESAAGLKPSSGSRQGFLIIGSVILILVVVGVNLDQARETIQQVWDMNHSLPRNIPTIKDRRQQTQSGVGKTEHTQIEDQQRRQDASVDAARRKTEADREQRRRAEAIAEELLRKDAARQQADSEREAQRRALALVLYHGRAIEGGDIDTPRGFAMTSSSECEQRCRADNRCIAMSFDRWNRRCFLKDELSKFRIDPKYLSAVRGNLTPADSTESLVIEKFSRKASPTAPYAVERATSFAECERSCLSDARCEAFNYRRSEQRCSRLEQPDEYQADNSTDLGVKRQPAPRD